MTTGQRPIRIPHTKNPKVNDKSQGFTQRRGRPFLFMVRDPMGRPAFSEMLALHTNPEQITEKMTKSKTVAMTYGGFVEWNWPDELDTLSASHTTGAFLGPHGLVSGFDRLDATSGDADRKNTIAWERKEDLIEIFRNNGLIYDGFGKPVLRGTVEMIYDRGIYRGYFTNFTETEVADKPFSFQLSWEFKIEQTIYKFPAFRVNEFETLLSNRIPGARDIPPVSEADIIVNNRSTKASLIDGDESQQVPPQSDFDEVTSSINREFPGDAPQGSPIPDGGS